MIKKQKQKQNKPRRVLNSVDHNPQKCTLFRPFTFDVVFLEASLATVLKSSSLFQEKGSQDDLQNFQVKLVRFALTALTCEQAVLELHSVLLALSLVT